MGRCRQPPKGGKALPSRAIPATLDALAEAVESGAGLPAVARAAAKVLDASVALIDRSSAVLAVAGASSDQEKKLIAGGEGVTGSSCGSPTPSVGELRYRGAGTARSGDRPHGDDPARARAGALALAGVGERGGGGRIRRRRARPPGHRSRRHRRPRAPRWAQTWSAVPA